MPLTRAYVIFSGGGAKGIVHVGGLRAIETVTRAPTSGVGTFHGFDVQGYAGTSAGAIVAALAAAGFRSDELVDPNSEKTIYSYIEGIKARSVPSGDGARGRASRFVDSMFGKDGWRTIDFVRVLLSKRLRAIVFAVTGLLLLSPLLGALAIWIGLPPGPSGILMAVAWAGAIFAASAVATLCARGLVALDRFRDDLDLAIAHKVFGPQARRGVTFADLRNAGRPSLRIVASNLTAKELTLFSAERTPDVIVADAVVASACFPIVFRPRTLASGGEQSAATGTFVDGGLVSNLPAWAFDEERRLDRDAATIAFDIVDRHPPPEQPRHRGPGRSFAIVRDMVRTAVFGSGILNTRAVSGIANVPLPASVDLFAFDMTLETAKAEIDVAARTAREQLEARFETVPWFYRQAGEESVRRAQGLFGGTVRFAVAKPDPGAARSLRLQLDVGFDGFCDQGMVLPVDGSIAGEAFRSGDPLFESAPFPPPYDMSDARYARLRALVWKEMSWVLCVPIGQRSSRGDHPRFVVILDGDARLERSDDTIRKIESLIDDLERTFGYLDAELPLQTGLRDET